MVESIFVSPDWNAPLDTDARLTQVPPHRTTKGVLLQSIANAAVKGSGRAPAGPDHYVAFKDYPLSQLIQIQAEGALLAFPGTTPRQAMRMLGGHAYRAIRESMIGKVIFSVAGRDFVAAVKLVSKLYTTFSANSVEVKDLQDTTARIELRDVWSFPDAYHVGIFEEAYKDFDRKGDVKVQVHSVNEVDLSLNWE